MRISDGATNPTPAAPFPEASDSRALATTDDPSRSARRQDALVTLGAAAAALAACAFYLPYIATGFASEDFLILARLSRQGLLSTLREEFVSPWLGLVAVGFWRPVSTFLLGLELALFGLQPARFHAAHLVVHALNAWLVARIVLEVVKKTQRAGAAPPPHWIAIAAAGLFAIHPFHPSAVLFTGAFATLFAATFSLLAIGCFLGARPSSDHEISNAGARRKRLDLAALACFALALGCYEATVVLPAVLVVLALTIPAASAPAGDRAGGSSRTGALRRTLPFFGVAALYLLARILIVGSAIGGYAALRERYLSSPAKLLADIANAVWRILHPWLVAGEPGPWLWTVAAVGVLGALVLASARNVLGPLAGLAATVLFLAPFAFVGLVPANGRYAYLAIAGAVLAFCSLGASIVARRRRAGSLLVAIATIALVYDWLGALRMYLGAHDTASRLVSRVRADLIGVIRSHERDGVLLFVDDPPDFIKGGSQEPIAKVLQYGLAESVRPPFGPAARAPVPLPFGVTRAARAALDALPGTIRYRWDWDAGRLTPIASEPSPSGVTLDVTSYDPATGRLEARCERCDSTRAVILTPALPVVIDPIETRAAGRATFEVPADLLRGLARLDEGDAFLWVEEPARLEDPAAISPIVRFSLDGDVARNVAEAAAKIRRGRNGTNAR